MNIKRKQTGKERKHIKFTPGITIHIYKLFVFGPPRPNHNKPNEILKKLNEHQEETKRAKKDNTSNSSRGIHIYKFCVCGPHRPNHNRPNETLKKLNGYQQETNSTWNNTHQIHPAAPQYTFIDVACLGIGTMFFFWRFAQRAVLAYPRCDVGKSCNGRGTTIWEMRQTRMGLFGCHWNVHYHHHHLYYQQHE